MLRGRSPRLRLVTVCLGGVLALGGPALGEISGSPQGNGTPPEPARMDSSTLGDTVQDRFFHTSDGVRLHYLLGGVSEGKGHTLAFVPGWTMPGDIWAPQLANFAAHYRVAALDPRSQGRSDIALDGHEPGRRAKDIDEWLKALGNRPVVLVGWSLGVLESLSYVKHHGNAGLEALVLVDNSIGEDPPPRGSDFLKRYKENRSLAMEGFVRAMFRTPQPESFLQALTNTALRTPMEPSLSLLNTLYPREVWREAVYSVQVPLLYAVTPRFREQSENLKRKRPQTWTEVFPNAGHALFVDQAQNFNRLLQRFLDDLDHAR